MMCYQRNCESNWVTYICIHTIYPVDTPCDTFLVIMAPKQQQGYQVVCLWSGANLYISILIPKGTICKCDKNNLLRLVLQGTPVNLVSFSEYFSFFIIHGTFTI